AVDASVDRRGGFNSVLHALDANPHASVAREREAEDAVVEDLLHARRVEHRDHVINEGELGLMSAGGALAGMVGAHQGQHAAMLGGAGMVGMAKYVAGAVEAWTLAVPHTEYPIILALASELSLLRAPKRSGSQVLVEPSHELDVIVFQDPLCPQHGRL